MPEKFVKENQIEKSYSIGGGKDQSGRGKSFYLDLEKVKIRNVHYPDARHDIDQ